METSRGLKARLASAGPLAAVLRFFQAHERLAPAFFFLGGTVWDAVTIFRIDSLIDNGLVIAYLLILGLLVPITALVDIGRITNDRIRRLRPWFPAVKQFLLGALFSTFVFFYLQSASLSSTSVFLGLLIALLIANEFLHERVASVHLDLALYLVATATFFVYFVPMVTKLMNVWTFIAGCALALAGVLLLSEFLRKRGVFGSSRDVTISRAINVGLFGLFLVAYFGNWIPPVPLALRDGGIYHEVTRNGSDYRLRYEKGPWYAFWKTDDSTFRHAPGDAVYCYTAVFAPTRLRNRIYHVWQTRDPATGEWTTADRIGYEIVGGRDNGYRGYTLKRSIRPGSWRVAVETGDGRLLSRIGFEVVERAGPPAEWAWDVAD